ncbi:A/G-specific adenine glycosylase [Ferruginibacter sp. SUN002]|uniref:A/G-specific adenine glycosylase n=1 Tax=Ferruginibacter sp. SUN002 TaxID=2937789 RepID=UPI003D3695DD
MTFIIKNKQFFTVQLLMWNDKFNRRAMPWKGEKDPYKIWLSEIILQQTRVDQGLEYYNRFIKTFPTVEKLAVAPETKVFKLWEGLGYYTRCKNLIATAKFIAKELNGKFPDKYEDILSLKGIGPYTAAAIASFAFNLPYAVVDGNVFRVLSRYFNIDTAIDSTEGKKQFTLLAEELLDKEKPGLYNQALMDFGATVCKPQSPNCSDCPLNKTCLAFSKGWVDKLPVKEKSITKKTRWLYYLVIKHNDLVYVQKRGGNDIWENLYEFFPIEMKEELTMKGIKVLDIFKEESFSGARIKYISDEYKQLLTHQIIKGRFIQIDMPKPFSAKGFKAITIKEMSKLPFPKFITLFLEDKNVSLNS